jgi:Flp pilus assembly protein TadB
MVHNDDHRAVGVRSAQHRARDRFFLLVLVAMVALGLVSLYYSLNWVTGLIILGLVILVAGIGWITGTLGGRER